MDYSSLFSVAHQELSERRSVELPESQALFCGSEPQSDRARMEYRPHIDPFWCFVTREPSTEIRLTVAEMSRSLLQQDRVGRQLLVRSSL